MTDITKKPAICAIIQVCNTVRIFDSLSDGVYKKPALADAREMERSLTKALDQNNALRARVKDRF